LGEACFSPALIALLTPIVAALVAGFGILYRDGNKSRNDQILDLIEQRDNLLNQLRGAAPVLDEAKTVVQGHVERKRHP
jgi:hypothetical protein